MQTLAVFPTFPLARSYFQHCSSGYWAGKSLLLCKPRTCHFPQRVHRARPQCTQALGFQVAELGHLSHKLAGLAFPLGRWSQCQLLIQSEHQVSFFPYQSLHRAGCLQGKRGCTGLPQPPQPCPLNTGANTPLSTLVHPTLLLYSTLTLLTHSRKDQRWIRSRLSLPPKHLLSYSCELFRMKQFISWPNRKGSYFWKRETSIQQPG